MRASGWYWKDRKEYAEELKIILDEVKDQPEREQAREIYVS